MSANKTVVISDIHLSDGQPYSWFKNPTALVNFLNQTANDNTVEELVLLGDIVDTWLYPVDIKPFTFFQIMKQWDDTVVPALKNCITKIPNVYYINGNHDMSITQADWDTLAVGSKRVQWISYNDYNQKYPNLRHLEHGNAVDMFNAQDNSDDTLAGFPLGFYITRMVASTGDRKGAFQKIINIIEEWLRIIKADPTKLEALEAIDRRIPIGKGLVTMIIGGLEDYTGVKDYAKIRFADHSIDNKYTVHDVKGKYWTLLGRWWEQYRSPEQIKNVMLAGLLPTGLDWYANQLLSQKTSRVVVLGHTHLGETIGSYVNDGCWLANEKLTYAEITGTDVILQNWN